MMERSAGIDRIKGLAIISVICAHCNTVFGGGSVFAGSSSLILQNAGTFGVICFMVISGMLFRVPQNSPLKFLGKKLKLIGIPWLISGTCVWLYVALRQLPLRFGDWFRYVIGDGSYLYYLSVLMLFYILFAFLPFMRTKAALIICQMVTAVSCIWCYQLGSLSPYLNPLNWIGFFALGICISHRKEKNVRGGGANAFIMCVVCGLSLAAWTVQVIRGDGGSYWGGFHAITTWLGAGVLAVLGAGLPWDRVPVLNKLLCSIGESSFFVYIWHMPIAGITARLMSVGPLKNLVLLRPIIVLSVTMVACRAGELLLKKMRLSKCGFLLGLGSR